MTELSSEYRKAHVGNLFYHIHKEGAIVTACEYTTADGIKIPSHVDGVPVMGISECAFADKPFKNIELPDTIEYIGRQAFKNCSQIKNIKLPENLQTIDDRAFMYCSNLTSIIIPGKAKLGFSAFFGCTNLSKVIIKDGVKCIPERCFCTSKIDKITIPDSVEEIYKSAFSFSGNEIVRCTKGSVAETMAVENYLRIEYKVNSKINQFFNQETTEEKNGRE